jgi:hypothetical protein
MFLGWYDPEKKRPARLKLEEAIERYEEKFGSQPETVLTSVVDAEELASDKKSPEIIVRGVNYIPRFTFYVGIDELPGEEVAEAA